MTNVKQITLEQPTAHAIAYALMIYADAAYPPGGSECAQASNQTLKTLAAQIQRTDSTPLALKKRQMPMIKAAIRWFYGEDNPLEKPAGIDPEQLITALSGGK